MFVNALQKTDQIQTLWLKTNTSKRTPHQCALPESRSATILAEAEKSAIQEIQKIRQTYIFRQQAVGCEAKILELITDYMT